MSRGQRLLDWYAEQQRDLPWRRTKDPYRILVSEVMLQQTPVRRVIPRYREFLGRFPDIDHLAEAPLADLLEVWQGLGYPARAKRLREAARIVRDGGWPDSAACLESLPGVGPYTAGAVASIAFGEPVPAVDSNASRVVSRWRGEVLHGTALKMAAREEMTGEPAEWNQAVMELGALVCRALPRCDECPVSVGCAAPGLEMVTTRQAQYRGSLREVRGDVLRALQHGESPSVAELAHTMGHPVERIRKAAAGLESDGLVEMRRGRLSLAA